MVLRASKAGDEIHTQARVLAMTVLKCPLCGSLAVKTRQTNEQLLFREAIISRICIERKLDIIVPVRTCQVCVYEWTDDEAAEIRQAAIDGYRKNRWHW